MRRAFWEGAVVIVATTIVCEEGNIRDSLVAEISVVAQHTFTYLVEIIDNIYASVLGYLRKHVSVYIC